jgi:hypothetical protein
MLGQIKNSIKLGSKNLWTRRAGSRPGPAMRTVFSSINKFGFKKIIVENLFLPRIYQFVLGLC